VLLNSAAAQRDPATRARLALTLLLLLVLWPALRLSEFDVPALWSASSRDGLAQFFATFFPLVHTPEFLALVWRESLRTLAIATAGVSLALLLAVPVALLATRSLSIAQIGPAAHTLPGRWLRGAARVVLLLLRSLPELVLALLFVRAVGLGATAGVLAIAISYGGMLGKVYADILESSEPTATRALLEAGASRSGALLYGMLPSALPELVSYTVYRWECAIRATAVMGFVGAGGLGQQLDVSMRNLNGGEAATILVAFLLLVLLADAISAALRKWLA
jgi:phosphonate transport system permease protein